MIFFIKLMRFNLQGLRGVIKRLIFPSYLLTCRATGGFGMLHVHPKNKKESIQGIRVAPGVLLKWDDHFADSLGFWTRCEDARIGRPFEPTNGEVCVRRDLSSTVNYAETVLAYLAMPDVKFRCIAKDPRTPRMLEDVWAYVPGPRVQWTGSLAFVRFPRCLEILSSVGFLEHFQGGEFGSVEHYRLTDAGLAEGKRLLKSMRDSIVVPSHRGN